MPQNSDEGFRLPKFSTIDAAYKHIGSLPPPKKGRNVATMDKYVSMELQGNIIQERLDETVEEPSTATLNSAFSSIQFLQCTRKISET